jgi:prepilin peptidase CpaA
MEVTAGVAGVVVIAASAAAAITDVWKFKVYNSLTLPLLVSGPVFFCVCHGWWGLTHSLCGALLGFAILIIPYMFGGIGAGDVKFLAGMGAWLGVDMMCLVVAVGCLATGVYAAGTALAHGRARQTCRNLKSIICRPLKHGHNLHGAEKMESVQVIVKQEDRRSRLVPISAMMAFGALVSLSLQMMAQ